MEKKLDIKETSLKKSDLQKMILKGSDSLSKKESSVTDLSTLDNEVTELKDEDINNLIKKDVEKKAKISDEVVILENFVVEEIEPEDDIKSTDLSFKETKQDKESNSSKPGEENEEDQSPKKEEPKQYMIVRHKVFANGKITKEPIAMFVKDAGAGTKLKETKMYSKDVSDDDKKKDVKANYAFLSIDYKNKKIDFLEVKKYEDGSMEKIPLKYNEFQSNFSFEQEIENKMDRVPVIANQQNALSNIKKINQMYGAWRQGDDFNSLPKNEKDKISNSEFLQKAYDYAYRGNVPGLSALLKKNQDKSINLTSVNSLALKMSINNGNQDIMRVLIANGADPRGINLDMVNSPALKDYLKQEIYKREHPVLSTIGIKGK